jgi:hypothetical protein
VSRFFCFDNLHVMSAFIKPRPPIHRKRSCHRINHWLTAALNHSFESRQSVRGESRDANAANSICITELAMPRTGASLAAETVDSVVPASGQVDSRLGRIRQVSL